MLRHRNDVLFPSSSFYHEDIIQDIKHQVAYIPLDYWWESNPSNTTISTKNYELPDGTLLSLKTESFQAPEILFQPLTLLGRGENSYGIHECMYKAITQCDSHVLVDMFNHLILCGGNTMFPGFIDRIIKEMTCLAPCTMKIQVYAPPERKYLTFRGASMFASMLNTTSSTFIEQGITKAEYDEYGPTIVHRKFKTIT
jgi:actin, other eukaryote